MIPGCTCVVAPELALVYELLWLIAQPLWLIAEPLRIIAVPVSVFDYLFVCLVVSLFARSGFEDGPPKKFFDRVVPPPKVRWF